eukprot:6214845-Pleurochrysis_carterae.AAC.4
MQLVPEPFHVEVGKHALEKGDGSLHFLEAQREIRVPVKVPEQLEQLESRLLIVELGVDAVLVLDLGMDAHELFHEIVRVFPRELDALEDGIDLFLQVQGDGLELRVRLLQTAVEFRVPTVGETQFFVFLLKHRCRGRNVAHQLQLLDEDCARGRHARERQVARATFDALGDGQGQTDDDATQCDG